VLVDGFPLDSDAARELEEISRVAAVAQFRAHPSKRAAPKQLALDVLGAFRLACRVEAGRWTPRYVVRVHGCAMRSAFARRQEL